MLPTDKWVGFVPEGQLGNHLWELASVFSIARARNSSWCQCIVDYRDRYHIYVHHLHWVAEPPRDDCPGLNWVNDLFWFTPFLMPIGDDGVFAGYH
jgi:hypothetical protein